jgi:hypothetical protein
MEPAILEHHKYSRLKSIVNHHYVETLKVKFMEERLVVEKNEHGNTMPPSNLRESTTRTAGMAWVQ